MVRFVSYLLRFYRSIGLGGTGKRGRENRLPFSSDMDAFSFQVFRRFFGAYDRRGLLNDFIIRFFSGLPFGLERSYDQSDFSFAGGSLYFFFGSGLESYQRFFQTEGDSASAFDDPVYGSGFTFRNGGGEKVGAASGFRSGSGTFHLTFVLRFLRGNRNSTFGTFRRRTLKNRRIFLDSTDNPVNTLFLMKIRIAHPVWDWILSAVFLIGFPVVVLFSLNFPNVILQQGTAHRIFYFHVPVAWVALYGPIFSLVFAVLYLIRKESKWDLLSLSANQIALLFAVGVIFSGRIWALSAWGVSWDKTDARLQSFTVLFISLIAYFVFRILITDVSKKKVFSAFLSILCAVNAVVTWGAIRWMDNPGNHPESILGKGGMDSDIRLSFWMGVLAYHVLFLVLFRFAYRLSKIEDLRESLPEREG